MSYRHRSLKEYEGQFVGESQHCVAFVKEITGAPQTASWKRGSKVVESLPLPGTAIATFDPDGKYGNHTDGRSHAAVVDSYLDSSGIWVYDQWVGQPCHKRLIRRRGGAEGVHPANDADAYYVIE